MGAHIMLPSKHKKIVQHLYNIAQMLYKCFVFAGYSIILKNFALKDCMPELQVC